MRTTQSLLLICAVSAIVAVTFAVACGGTIDSPSDSTRGDAGTRPPGRSTTTVPASTRVPRNHRAVAETCGVITPAEPTNVPDGGTGAGVKCHSNAECAAGRNGRCEGNSHDGWRCNYDVCSSDGECGTGVCACQGGFRSTTHVCLSSGCRIDADCGSNGYCSPTLGDCGHYGKSVGYFCHTAKDECVDDEDCGGVTGSVGGGYCAYSKEGGRWVCSRAECAG